jgi:hypothetical protein
MKWKKPVWNKRASYTKSDLDSFPKEILLRQIKVQVDQPGIRTKSFHIVTTLLDPVEYPATEITQLYFQRWDVELYLRDIKTTMGMDILRCKTPEMIRKEILMHFIAYNCIRRLMDESTKRKGLRELRVSFKGSVQAIRKWEPHFIQINSNRDQQLGFLAALYDSIADCVVPERPGRREPRCLKRRPKPYQILTRPRDEFTEIPHRGRYRAEAA